MSKTSKSPRKVLDVALKAAQQAFPAYSHEFSPKKFTQHQLFACLVLKSFLKTDYRGVVEHLKDCPALAESVGFGDVVIPGKRTGLRNVHDSPMMADNRIYISSREGDTAVVDPRDGCEILAKNHLDDVFDASPITIGSRLILRGRKNLYCIE